MWQRVLVDSRSRLTRCNSYIILFTLVVCNVGSSKSYAIYGIGRSSYDTCPKFWNPEHVLGGYRAYKRSVSSVIGFLLLIVPPSPLQLYITLNIYASTINCLEKTRCVDCVANCLSICGHVTPEKGTHVPNAFWKVKIMRLNGQYI